MEHRTLPANGIHLHAVTAGDPDAPLVVLLHGFPELWYAWKDYLPQLAEAGFFAVAPDQRGYNLSDKPPRVKDYAIDALAADVIGVMDALGKDRAIVVGHDWGAAVAWWTAMTHPDRVDRLVVMNVPHPLAMREFMFRHPSQLLKSWYMFFFQVPLFPELTFARRDGRDMFERMRRVGRPGAFTDADEPIYLEAWRQPAAVTSMINWYRAALGMLTSAPPDRPIEPRTLIIWGKQDDLLDHRMAEASAARCRSVRIEYFEEATHWVQHEEQESVSRLLLSFCGTEEG